MDIDPGKTMPCILLPKNPEDNHYTMVLPEVQPNKISDIEYDLDKDKQVLLFECIYENGDRVPYPLSLSERDLEILEVVEQLDIVDQDSVDINS